MGLVLVLGWVLGLGLGLEVELVLVREMGKTDDR